MNERKPPGESQRQSQPQPLRKAVALKYNPGEHAAPVVAAKGQGHIAERILELARENGVPIQEEPSLVEVLSKLDIDQEIPPELYALVAEVLSYIYRADRRLKEWVGDG
jgi:flagellar biosynthesis protein